MQKIRGFIQKVQTLKRALSAAQDAKSSVVQADLYEYWSSEVSRLTNALYDATGDLDEALFEETGAHGSELSDLVKNPGYHITPSAPLPRRVATKF